MGDFSESQRPEIAAERFAALKVIVIGTLEPKIRTIQVESIAAVK